MSYHRHLFMTLYVLALAWSSTASAQETIEPVHVPGYIRVVDEHPALAGRILLGELNCLSCHRADAATIPASPILKRSAPVLDTVGSRVRAEWLREFLTDPHGFKPGTAMPDVLAGMNDEQRRATVEALVHFLSSTGSVSEIMADADTIARGETQFHQLGCIACHGAHPLDSQVTAANARPNIDENDEDDDEFQPYDPGPSSAEFFVSLGDPAKKYTILSLRQFLLDPHAVRPSGRMPGFNLTEEEATDIAAYFFRDVEFTPNVAWAYYEGSWDSLPNFDALEPKATGHSVGFDLTPAQRPGQFGLRFEGWVHIASAGRYAFYLGSDDGSRLTINGSEVISVDGLHPYQQKKGERELEAGVFSLEVEFFQQGGGAELTVEYEGPGVPRQPLASAVTPTKDQEPTKTLRFDTDLDLVAKGRALFGELGCAACHSLRENGEPIAHQRTDAIPPLTKLNLHAASGCLGVNPKPNVPRYPLNEPQHVALQSAINDIKKRELTPSPQERVHQTLAVFNCYGCHERNKFGGVTRDINENFATTTPEMGDEGRLPPTLTGIGDKLNVDWLRHIFAEGANDRPYMLARMPKFRLDNVGHLVDDLPKLDVVPLREKPEPLEPTHRMQSNGRFLVGDKGLSCIKCHRFGEHAGTGLSSIDLVTMTKRLREDWFYRYMLNPQDYRPGTRMPAPWPFGQATVRNVLEADAMQQMMAVWSYLGTGSEAQIPTGLVASAIELTPKKTPIVYRNFIEGVNPRAIAVGYPEKVHLAFDAEHCNWALIWHGQFIDASKHWTGRGNGFQPPLGDHVLALDARPAFAVLDNASTPWPDTTDIAFRGYHFDHNRRPIFRYRFAALSIEDHPEPLIDGTHPEPGWRRTVTVMSDSSGETATVWFRAAAGQSIQPQDDGSYVVNDSLRLRIQSDVEPVARTIDNRAELLIPVKLIGGKTTFVVDMIW